MVVEQVARSKCGGVVEVEVQCGGWRKVLRYGCGFQQDDIECAVAGCERL